MALRWKLEPKETGLRGVIAGPRSSWLHDGTKRYATVAAIGRGNSVRWYWVAGWSSGVPHMNTSSKPVPTATEAKAQALAYVKAHLPQGETGGAA